jgi:hypothetical protein
MARRKAGSKLNVYARALGYRSYADYLWSDHWLQIRARWLETRCFCCGATSELKLHHIRYDNLGRELRHDLVTVCGRCHTLIHEAVARGTPLDSAHFAVNPNRKPRNGSSRKARRRVKSWRR